MPLPPRPSPGLEAVGGGHSLEPGQDDVINCVRDCSLEPERSDETTGRDQVSWGRSVNQGQPAAVVTGSLVGFMGEKGTFPEQAAPLCAYVRCARVTWFDGTQAHPPVLSD